MNDSDLLGRVAAYFLIPLPEPQGIPKGFPLRRQSVEDLGTFLERSARTRSSLDSGPTSDGYVSIVAHHVQARSADAYGLSDLLQLAHRVLPWVKPELSLRGRVRGRVKGLRRLDLRSSRATPRQDLTVR